jgi:hypothetical protein
MNCLTKKESGLPDIKPERITLPGHFLRAISRVETEEYHANLILSKELLFYFSIFLTFWNKYCFLFVQGTNNADF